MFLCTIFISGSLIGTFVAFVAFFYVTKWKPVVDKLDSRGVQWENRPLCGPKCTSWGQTDYRTTAVSSIFLPIFPYWSHGLFFSKAWHDQRRSPAVELKLPKDQSTKIDVLMDRTDRLTDWVFGVAFENGCFWHSIWLGCGRCFILPLEYWVFSI